MNGLTSEDINVHSAGRLGVILKIVNPYDPTGVTLDKVVSTAHMRLHLWVWASVRGVQVVNPSYDSFGQHGWGYTASPYVFTDGKPVAALQQLFSSNVLQPHAETYTTSGTTYFRGEAVNMSFSGDYYGYKGEAVWQFRNDHIFSDESSDAQKRTQLRNVLSTVEGNSVFVFRMMDSKSVTYPDFYGPGEAQTLTFDGLNTILGGDSYASRDGDWTLYYDPSGSYNTYKISPVGVPENKLFVFHIGGSALATNPYFFDPSLGF